MHFFRKASSVPSSPSPTNASGGSNGSSADKRGPSRRRERPRKPWHLGAYELGLQFTNRARIQSPPDSPYFSRKSQSPSPAPAQLDHLRWTPTAVPQPLPLPDTSLTRKPESSGLTLAQRVVSLENDASSTSKTGGAESTNSSSNFRKRFSQYANIESGDDFRLSIPARSAPASAFSSPDVSPPRSNGEADYFPFSTASNVPNSSSDFIQTRLSHDSSVENGYDSSRWVMASPRSAPTSGFSSPIVSPQRSNDRDLLPSSLPPRESPLRDVPDLGRFAVGHASPMSPVKTMQSPDRSLQNSPMLQSPELNPHGPNKFSFPLHHKFVQGRSKEWPESSRVSAQNSRLVTTSPRSAPTSGFSSPVVSPQRSKTPDFQPSSLPPRESQLQDVLDLGWLAAGQASQLLPLKSMQSLDRYPRSRPTLQSPRLSAPGPNKFSFPLHRKLVTGSSKEWPESSRVSAHRLPLPPGASPSQSFVLSATPAVHNATEIPNASQKKATEWVKGKLLGCGTYGRVYVGTHRETGAYCAMKEVDIVPDDPKSAECVKQLEQEIRVLQHLKHPNIVQYYGSEVVDDHFYIYLEYVHPGSINKYIQEHYGHVTESIVRNFTRHILSGLAFLHSTKTIHRDIKGANLLVDASGTVKVADFGMAKHLTGRAYELSLKGSPHWMAPEVLKAVMRNDANPELALAVDIWSLGCTVIEMFTGKPPWGEFLGVQAMFNILNKAPPIPETLSPEGKDFLCCCLRRNPADRPSAVMLLEHPFLRDAKPQGSNP